MIQCLQYKIGLHLQCKLLHSLHDLFKAHTGFLTLLDPLGNTHLTYRCRTGIEYMNFDFRMLLQIQIHAEHRTVVRTA
jgi:hypothetical protein